MPALVLLQLRSVGLPELIVLVLLFGILGSFVFWIWMLIDAATKLRGDDKIVWVIIIAVTHVIGALIYFIAKRPRYIRVDPMEWRT